MADIVIKNAAYLITMNPERRILQDGAVAIDKGKIVAVGKSSDVLDQHNGDVVIDAKGKVVMPGLIDGHAHPAQYLSKGIADDVDGITWVYKRMFPFETELSPEDAYYSALGEFVEMIRHGTTCHNNPGVPGVDATNAEMTAKAMAEIGMRGILSRYTFDTSIPGFEVPQKLLLPTHDQVRMNEELVKKWNGAADGLVRMWFSWRLPYNASDELIVESKELADKYHVGVHTHANMTDGENEAVKSKWGYRTLERYEKLGVLGPNMYLVHMGWTTLDELDLLKKHDVKVCHTPTASVHATLGSLSHGKFPEMLQKGITVTLGSDSASAGRTRDMFFVMYMAATGHKEVRLDHTLVGPYKALEMATIDCAKGLLWDDQIGSIEVGKRADVITLDLSQPEWWPMWDLVANLVYSGDGSWVDNVIINGKLVMKDREILTVDTAEVMQRLKEHAADIQGRMRTNHGVDVRTKWPVS